MMKVFILGLAAFMLAASTIHADEAFKPTPRKPLSAVDILASAKAATGGDAWNRIKTIHETAIVTCAGSTGDYEEWTDLASGRNASTWKIDANIGAQGYDGSVVWKQDQTGQAYAVSDPTYSQTASLDAFIVDLFSRFPNRLFLIGAFPRQVVENHHAYALFPLNRQTTLWIDVDTHLIDRTVAVLPEQTITTYYSDYQNVSGVKLPFAIRQSNGMARYDTVYTFRTVKANDSIPETRFAQPPPVVDYTFDGGKTSTTIPFRYSGAQILFDMTINGQGPFPAVFDTGGSFLLTPDLAKRLALDPKGTVPVNGFGSGHADMSLTRVNDVDLGGVHIAKPLFVVGSTVLLGTKIIAGQDLLNRFVVRVDQDQQTLTFTRPEAFTYNGNGIVVPFRFGEVNGSTPEVDGSVDGIPGTFSIDTGAGGSLSLSTPFVTSNDLQEKYHTRFTVITGYGIGGETHGAMTRVHTLTFGGAAAHDLVTELSLDAGGFSSVKAVAGTIGSGVLHRFNIIFDYPRKRMIFEKNSHYGEPDIYNRSGLGMLESGQVIVVMPDSPAAEAGIHAGDTILEVGNQSPTSLKVDGIHNAFRQPVGTFVHLKVRSETQTRDVTIVLRDLI